MKVRHHLIILGIILVSFLFGLNTDTIAAFTFSTGNPDGLMATGSHPATPGTTQIESADDFILPSPTRITGATFTGLLPAGFTINDVTVNIYRVFPNDSTNPPSGHVPTRVNSPSDVSIDTRSFSGDGLTFSKILLNPSFTAANSVLNGINPIPNQTTDGEGAVTGAEVIFEVTFTTPLDLAADHYFFSPQVDLGNGDFLWLSAPKPIVAPGTAFSPDLQSWIRNDALAPDWLRIGTDIVGGAIPPTFNATFSLSGNVVPVPGTLLLLGSGIMALCGLKKRTN